MKQILRTREVLKALGAKSRATLDRRVKNDPTFPRPIAIAPGVRGFDAVAIAEWLTKQPPAGDVPNAQARDRGRADYWRRVKEGAAEAPRSRAHRMAASREDVS